MTEAETLERLVERLRALVPELLELNGAAQRRAPIELVTRLPENARHIANAVLEQAGSSKVFRARRA